MRLQGIPEKIVRTGGGLWVFPLVALILGSEIDEEAFYSILVITFLLSIACMGQPYLINLLMHHRHFRSKLILGGTLVAIISAFMDFALAALFTLPLSIYLGVISIKCHNELENEN